MTNRPRMYSDLATWWPLLCPASDYTDEAAELIELIDGAADGPASTLLELGFGGGSAAYHLRERYRLTLTDLSPEMIEVSRGVNPDCEHAVGDMRTLDLAGRTFDRVLLHDGVMYASSRDDLRATLRTARRHCAPGGGVVILPDFVRETYAPGTDQGGFDGEDGRGLRFLEWSWDPDPEDESFELAFAFLLREPDGTVAAEGDRHRLGLFSRAVWMEELAAAGFRARSSMDSLGRVVFQGEPDGGAAQSPTGGGPA